LTGESGRNRKHVFSGKSQRNPFMSDQADRLRRLVEERNAADAYQGASSRALVLPLEQSSDEAEQATGERTKAIHNGRCLVFTSGKGGVGSSTLVVNLAVALAQRGESVIAADADFGFANLDILCGASPLRDLGNVLAGECSVEEVLVEGPAGIRIVPGAHALRTMDDLLVRAPHELASEFAKLRSQADFLLVDVGTGVGWLEDLATVRADEIIAVATPEPASLADTHALVLRLRGLARRPALRVLVNQAKSNREAAQTLAGLAAASRNFLGTPLLPLGWVNSDACVGRSARLRSPFVVEFPHTSATRQIRRLAARLVLESRLAANSIVTAGPLVRKSGFRDRKRGALMKFG
jgi:flagellar biosynthesis protein FlhG